MLLFNILLSTCFATTSRIQSAITSQSEATTIYLRPGLASVLELPNDIVEARVGNPGDLKVLISQVSSKEITLFFKRSSVLPTNLIVRSGKKMFVFDVIPSALKHQDYLKVTSSVGSINQNFRYLSTKSILISPSVNSSEVDGHKVEVSEKVAL